MSNLSESVDSIMLNVPSLCSLGIQSIKKQLINGDNLLPEIYGLPSHIFDTLVAQLPPLALQKLQMEMPYESRNEYESTYDCMKEGRKRGRNGKFDVAWEALFRLRWSEVVDSVQLDDWQCMYWERHLQDCLDEAAEIALLPSFNGSIGGIQISDTLLREIGCEEHTKQPTSDYSHLSYHCQCFGSYARYLRLQSFLCVAETCELLSSCKLQNLVLWWSRTKKHVDDICKLLIQNNETLKSIEFFHCTFSSESVNRICNSLCNKSTQVPKIQHFSINTSIFDIDQVSVPSGLLQFLASGGSLCSLKLCGNHLNRDTLNIVLGTLLEANLGLSILDLSDNNIKGWLSPHWRSPSGLTYLGMGKSLKSLQVLNLRGNNLEKQDVENLTHELVHMRNLEVLNLSDNPIEDDGIRILIRYLSDASERCYPLADLNLENCDLTNHGVAALLDTLSTLKSLKYLSIADNGGQRVLDSPVPAALAKIFATHIRKLNIEGIGLGSSGFKKLQEHLVNEVKLIDINISKNHGGRETANFLSKLITCAPELKTVNAAHNFMPAGSSSVIFSALKTATCYLAHLDLTGYAWELQPEEKLFLAAYEKKGKFVLKLPKSVPYTVLHDDDP